MPRAVHQLLAALAPGDAISNQALTLQAHLRSAGYLSELFAEKLHPKIATRARPLWQYPRTPSSQDVCLLHYSIGSAAAQLFATLAQRRVLVYHNVTPADWFRGFSRELVAQCHHGRRELAGLASATDLALAVSEFNRRELDSAGFRRTGVMPLLPAAGLRERPSSRVFRRLFEDGRDNILYVGRISPNKRIEDLLRVFAVYQRFVHPASRLLLAGDERGNERYQEALLRMVDDMRLDEVVFTGHLEDDELLACYAAADVLLCLSEHEGVGVPLLEAMLLGIPVVAYDAAAVRETLRGGGVLLTEKRPEVVAELIDLVLRRPGLREAVLATQRRVVEELQSIDYGRLLLERLQPVLEAA
jgi:glycosyltransferase involved in cell wall biosynthesis